MKTLILTFLLGFILIPPICWAQIIRKNTISFVFQPNDLGIGIKYDRQITDFGFYTSATWGNYKFNGGYINDHIKLTAGIVKYIPRKQNLKITNLFSVGLSGNHYGKRKYFNLNKSEIVFFPVSVDVGAGIRIGRWSTKVDFDFIKAESALSFGYNF